MRRRELSQTRSVLNATSLFLNANSLFPEKKFFSQSPLEGGGEEQRGGVVSLAHVGIIGASRTEPARWDNTGHISSAASVASHSTMTGAGVPGIPGNASSIRSIPGSDIAPLDDVIGIDAFSASEAVGTTSASASGAEDVNSNTNTTSTNPNPKPTIRAKNFRKSFLEALAESVEEDFFMDSEREFNILGAHSSTLS